MTKSSSTITTTTSTSTSSPAKATTSTSTSSPAKGRKKLAKHVPYSPRTNIPNINKVFVVGAPFGIVLIRTERQNSKDDAFTNDAVKMIEDQGSDVATKLGVIKICSRRESSEGNLPILQTSMFHSRWFVFIVEEDKNDADNRRIIADRFIKFLNEIQWKWPQQFVFTEDQTKLSNTKIGGKLDMYLLDVDIAVILKQYIFEDFASFLEDESGIIGVFSKKCSEKEASDRLKNTWLNCPEL